MKRVVARNRGFNGPYAYYDNVTEMDQRVAKPSGQQTVYVNQKPYCLAHSCFRGPKTTNKPYIVPKTSLPWRNPSLYRSLVLDIRRGPATTWIQSFDWMDRAVTSQADEKAIDMTWIPGRWEASKVLRDDNRWNQSITECLLKIGDGKADLSVAMAEARRTSNMIADAASTLFRAALAVRRGQVRRVPGILGLSRSPRRMSGQLANRFLEVKYGWSPLMSDIYGSVELLRQQLLRGLFVTGVRNLVDTSSITKGTYRWLEQSSLKDYSVSGELFRLHQCKMTGRVNDGFMRSAQMSGLVNPGLLAWEIVPYSFVVDWAIPIGSFLEACTATQGLDFVGGYTLTAGSLSLQGAQNAPLGMSGPPRKVDVNSNSMERLPLNEWPTARVYAKSPFRTGNVLSALALWRQLWRR